MQISQRSTKFFLLFFIFLFGFILVYTAWVSDDAYLTIRSVDNFVNGYGLRWNIRERVQIYTHPLWMFALSFTYYFLRNPILTFYVQTIVFSIITIYLFGVNFTRTPIKVILAFGALLLSKSFIDFSTAGLENPLTHLLMVLYLIVFFREDAF